MPVFIKKFAPQVIVLLVVLYWCWPHIMAEKAATSAAPPPAAKTPAFSTAMLSPTFPPVPKRTPFYPPGAEPTALVKTQQGPGVKNVEKKVEIAPTTAGLTLTGTFIVGDKRLAIINGQVYKEKDPLRSPQQTPDEAAACVVTGIFPHEVSLSWRGQPLQLTYTNVGTKPTTKSN